MNEVPINILFGIIGVVLGGFFGLNYSYKKYNFPYTIKKIDKLALLCGVLGGAILLIDIPYYINHLIGAFLLGVPFGMRPGYGNTELYIGLLILFVGLLVKSFI